MKRLLNKIDWVLFVILLFAAFSPLIYKGYRLFLVSGLENDTLSLAINWGYVYMIFESVNIFIIVPSYWFIRRNANTLEESNRNVIIIILFTMIAFVVCIFMVAAIGYPIALSSVSDANAEGYMVSFSYVYGYIVSYGATLSVHLFTNIFIVYIIVHNRKYQALLLTLFAMVTTMFIDTLLLSPGINPNAELLDISLSMFISSMTTLLITGIMVYFVDYKAWNNSFSLLNKDNLFNGWKVYSKNGMWLGMEALIWNLFNALGVFTWFLFMKSDNVETAFWIMDGLFWGFLLLPATAVTMFTAEGISNEGTTEGRKDVIKISMLLSLIALLSWVLLVPILTFIVIPKLIENNEYSVELIPMVQTMCWVFLIFIAIQVPTKVIYTYFSTTNRSYYLTIGTALGAILSWGLSFVSLILLWQLGFLESGIENSVAIYLLPIIYGIGILFIFVFYMVFYVLTLNDEEDDPWLFQRWKMKHELVKTTVASES